MENKLKYALSIQQIVLYTFLANDFHRAECVWIMKCEKDCVDTHLENAWKDNGYRCYDGFLADCKSMKWVKPMDDTEKQKYIALAHHNQKHNIKREKGEEIEWQKFYDELYPEKKG